jgi:hypothetical protein
MPKDSIEKGVIILSEAVKRILVNSKAKIS